MDTYDNLLDLGDFLEDLFQRKVDLVSVEWMSERFRASVMMEAIFCTRERGAA
jgi:predicted nucleotidyltransferase